MKQPGWVAVGTVAMAWSTVAMAGTPTANDRAEVKAAAAKLRAKAEKAEAELPAARKKAEDARAKLEADRATLEEAKQACDERSAPRKAALDERIETCRQKAAEAAAVRVAQLEEKREACLRNQPWRIRDKCTRACGRSLRSACASAEQRGDAYYDAVCAVPHKECSRGCDEQASHACDAIDAQLEQAKNGEGPDPCASLVRQREAVDAQCTTALDRAEASSAALAAAVARLESDVALRPQADRIVEDLEACGRLGMAAIPAGTVTWGSGSWATTVSVEPFCIDRSEVTVAEYRKCVKAGNCTPAEAPSEDNPNCNSGVAGRDMHPINCVDWNQANAYCAAKERQLPSSAEWEMAFGGGDGRKYPWGDAPASNQFCWDGEGNDLGKGNRDSTCPVGAFASDRSPFGVQDMAGNVREWTASRVDASSTSADAERVVRGGHWGLSDPSYVGYRWSDVPTKRSSDDRRMAGLGFRCAAPSSSRPAVKPSEPPPAPADPPATDASGKDSSE